MATLSGGDKLTARLQAIVTNVKKASKVEIGFQSDATYPDGTSVALVAAINEFGAPSKGQPPRPFFRSMIAEKSPDWGDTVSKLLVANDYDAEKTLGQMGVGIEGQLKQSIVDFTSPPLKQSTIDKKGFSTPLIDTSVMINSITSNVD